MTVSIIAAVAENNCIGKDNKLMWHIPNDLKRFKALTTGKPVIMGRKTFEAIGNPLPKRINIIITNQKDFRPAGCAVVHNIEDAFRIAEKSGLEEAFILGGGHIYGQTIDKADKMYLTHIHKNFDGDTFFPNFNRKDWNITFEEQHKTDENHKYDYTFINYERP